MVNGRGVNKHLTMAMTCHVAASIMIICRWRMAWEKCTVGVDERVGVSEIRNAARNDGITRRIE